MRIRTVKPEFFTHEGLFDAEKETSLPLRVSFAGLWCAADREGRFKWEPRRLGVAILPYDGIDFSRVLDALTTRGFIHKYTREGVDYGWIPTFTKHQVVNNREKPSELPEHCEMLDSDATTTREGRVTHASKAEGKGREHGREGNGKEREPEEIQSPHTKLVAFSSAIPEPFRSSREFRDLWNKWEEHCAFNRRPLSNQTRDSQLMECTRAGLEKSMARINYSISGNYTKLFWEDRPNGNGNGKHPSPIPPEPKRIPDPPRWKDFIEASDGVHYRCHSDAETWLTDAFERWKASTPEVRAAAAREDEERARKANGV